MNARLHHAATWPHDGLPGAGPLAECELDAACWRKRAIVLDIGAVRDMDECGDWATRQRPACLGTCETEEGCSCCGGECLTPQACEQPENLSGFPLEPYLARHKWLGPLLLALVSFVWLCLDGYLATLS